MHVTEIFVPSINVFVYFSDALLFMINPIFIAGIGRGVGTQSIW